MGPVAFCSRLGPGLAGLDQFQRFSQRGALGPTAGQTQERVNFWRGQRLRLFRELAGQELAPDFLQFGVTCEFLQRSLFDRTNRPFAHPQQQANFALSQSTVVTSCELADAPRRSLRGRIGVRLLHAGCGFEFSGPS